MIINNFNFFSLDVEVILMARQKLSIKERYNYKLWFNNIFTTEDRGYSVPHGF